MSFLDALTGDSYSRANRNNQQAVATGLQQGGNALTSTASNALQYLLGAPGQAGAEQVVDRGFDQGQAALGQGYDQTQGYLGGLQALYQPMVEQGGAAYRAYGDATGVNGPDGQARARASFTNDPGYGFAMDEGLGAVQRTAASRGGLAGGNATADILRVSQGLADQGYDRYVNRLAQGAQSYGQGVAGQAQGLGAQASAAQGYGSGMSALGTSRGSALANILGSAAGVQTGLGQGLASLTNQATNTLAQSNLYAAKGQTDASGNALGALFGGANLLAGGIGGAGGVGNVFSALGGGARAGSLIGRAGSAISDAIGFSPIPRF